MATTIQSNMLSSRSKPFHGGDRSFGEQLKDLRTEVGLSVAELARQLNVTRQAIWKWERDDMLPRQASLDALADALNAPGIAALRDSSNGDHTAAEPAPSLAISPLPDVINECKQSIAEAAGTTADKVTILIEV